MFASGCYFRAAPTQITPVFNWAATPYMNNGATAKATWELTTGPVSLPTTVTYFGPDGAASAVYTATGFTNVGAMTLPTGFHFSEPGTGYKEVTAVVTAVRPTCSRDDLRPALKQQMTMIDLRWHPGDPEVQMTSYLADHWPSVKEAQEIYFSKHPKKAAAPDDSYALATNVFAHMKDISYPAYTSPFSNAIVELPGGLTLPEAGPWTIAAADLKQPMSLTMDLAEHREPLFRWLWNSLSNQTQSALEKKNAELHVPPGAVYKAGPELDELVADLNRLIQGRLIYDEAALAEANSYFSGDTAKLLAQPAGADAARLNRLLLEDAFTLDIMRRPKVLFDAANQDYVFVDFAARKVSLYGRDGAKKWTADVGPTIDHESRMFPYFRNPGTPASQRNVGLWDVSPQPGMLLVRVMANHLYAIDLSNGVIVALAHT